MNRANPASAQDGGIPFLGAVIALVIGVSYALIAEDVRPLIPGLNPNDLALYVVILVVIAHVLDDGAAF